MFIPKKIEFYKEFDFRDPGHFSLSCQFFGSVYIGVWFFTRFLAICKEDNYVDSLISEMFAFFLYFTDVASCLSISLNSLLVYLIATKTPPMLRGYSIILLAYTLADFSISIPSIISHPM